MLPKYVAHFSTIKLWPTINVPQRLTQLGATHVHLSLHSSTTKSPLHIWTMYGEHFPSLYSINGLLPIIAFPSLLFPSSHMYTAYPLMYSFLPSPFLLNYFLRIMLHYILAPSIHSLPPCTLALPPSPFHATCSPSPMHAFLPLSTCPCFLHSLIITPLLLASSTTMYSLVPSKYSLASFKYSHPFQSPFMISICLTMYSLAHSMYISPSLSLQSMHSPAPFK